MKKNCLVLALSCLAGLVLALGLLPARAAESASPVPALVSDADTAGTNLRAAPSGEVLSVMPFSHGPRLVQVLESEKGWFRVKPFPVEEYELEGAATVPAEGWMHGSVLALCPCPSEDGAPWLYVSPGWSAETDIRIAGATPLLPLERRGEWFKVRVTLNGRPVERWLHEQQVSASVGELLECQPRRLTGLLWIGNGSSYKFDVDESGIATLKIRKGSERTRMAVYSGLAHELEALVRSSGLEKHHGFLERMDGGQVQSLSISFDTRQRIEVTGHSGPGGLPEGFGEALAPLLKAMDQALSPPAVTKALPPTALKALAFRVGGMVMGEDIQLYERMDKNGPCLVLSRNIGYSPGNRREAVLDAGQASELEALVEKNAVRAWNGFKGRPRMDVLDGESFAFSLTLRDGTRVTASGENKFPEGYHAFRRALNSFADKVLGVQE